MRLALRILINFMSSLEAQLDQVDNELRAHAAYRTQFQAAKKQLRAAVRAFADLNDDMRDHGID